MYWFSIFAQVIPKYQLKIDTILLKDHEIIKKSIENGDIASDTMNKLFEIYMNFKYEYNLFNPEICKNIGEKLAIDIRDTEQYFSEATNQCLWNSDPGNQTFNILKTITNINDFAKDPVIIVIFALFLPLIAKYGIKIIKWLVEKTASNDKIALGVTAVGLCIILLISILVC